MSKRPKRDLVRVGAKARHTGSVADDAISITADRSIRVDSRKLEAPQQQYDADVAWVERHHSRVKLFFAKLDRDQSDRLRTRLELVYPAEVFLRHFWENSRSFEEGLRDQVGKWPENPKRDLIDPSKMKAVKDHSDWVNFDYMARVGSQAVLDFFHISPAAVARFIAGQGSSDLRMVPKVRVLMTIDEMSRLLTACSPIAEEIRVILPDNEKLESLDPGE